MGNQADLVVAFDEQVFYGRIEQNALRPGMLLFIDEKWASDPAPQIREGYAKALEAFSRRGYDVREIPIDSSHRVTAGRTGSEFRIRGH
jgi:2-oxoglutarate ferredoxin oxidoreductase subunit alpha